MRPHVWHPPVELSPAEQTIVKRIRRASVNRRQLEAMRRREL